MPNQIIKWKCSNCEKEFDSEQECIIHEKKEDDVAKANNIFRDGWTLKEINDKFAFWELPKYLESVTKYRYFTFLLPQCCDKRFYRITNFKLMGQVGRVVMALWKCYNSEEYLDEHLDVAPIILNDIPELEKLFVDGSYLYNAY